MAANLIYYYVTTKFKVSFGAAKFIIVVPEKFIVSYFKVFWEANKIY